MIRSLPQRAQVSRSISSGAAMGAPHAAHATFRTVTSGSMCSSSQQSWPDLRGCRPRRSSPLQLRHQLPGALGVAGVADLGEEAGGLAGQRQCLRGASPAGVQQRQVEAVGRLAAPPPASDLRQASRVGLRAPRVNPSTTPAVAKRTAGSGRVPYSLVGKLCSATIRAISVTSSRSFGSNAIEAISPSAWRICCSANSRSPASPSRSATRDPYRAAR